jgi:hypothetical protein
MRILENSLFLGRILGFKAGLRFALFALSLHFNKFLRGK